MGVSHLLEHMVFKGTERRSARQLALELEVRGGSLDAYTSRDHTNYQAHVLDEDLPRALDVLTDLVRRPLLREEDLALERNVVLEEIATVEDTPGRPGLRAVQRAALARPSLRLLDPGHPGDRRRALRGRPAGGARRRATIRGNCVVAAAGQRRPRAGARPAGAGGLVRGGRTASRRGRRWRPGRRRAGTEHRVGAGHRPDPPGVRLRHLSLSATARRFALSMLTNAFGGGMSSRLFQRIREELGLAYAVYAYQQFFQSAGVAGVYVGTQPATADQAAEAIRAEYAPAGARRARRRRIWRRGKQQLKGQVMLSLESPASRMNRLATLALHGEPYRPLDAMLAEIDAVTRGRCRGGRGGVLRPGAADGGAAGPGVGRQIGECRWLDARL